ncbi:MAG TPA: hypothetical protein EYG67_05125 [Campylobacterales bacterium]|nr:hypothetical protein [Campylobacterales bacterium]HIP41966.1 hypothetical protein [Campylobacterales bacterium]
MKYISGLYLTILFIVLFILSISILFFSKESNKDRLQALSRYVIDDFQKDLAYENADLLSFSLALSEDGALKNALTADNQQQAYEILSAITKRFKEYTHIKTLRLQVFDNDFFIFAQSWGNTSAGMPMWWFRDDLEKLKHNKRPKVGMETGRMLTFKATIPIRNGAEYIGYLEVIKFVDEFSKKLHEQGVELFALMDTKYLQQASLMQEFPFLNEYIIANKNFNNKLKRKADFIDWAELSTLGYYYKEKILYILEPMYNGAKEEIGKYLIVLPPETVEHYKKRYQDISTFTRLSNEDVYKVVKLWEHPSGSYKTVYDKRLIEWLPKLHKEDKISLTKEAKEILERYTKNELIDIVLENNYKERKVGEIQ